MLADWYAFIDNCNRDGLNCYVSLWRETYSPKEREMFGLGAEQEMTLEEKETSRDSMCRNGRFLIT